MCQFHCFTDSNFLAAPRLNGYVENTKVLLREQGEKLLITYVEKSATYGINN